MAMSLPVMGSPLHAHGVRTPAAYLAAQAAFITALRARFPDQPWRDPWPAPDGAVPIISGGRWLVVCTCQNGCSASPAWDLACCFECGAIYRHLAWPAHREALETRLLASPASARHWTPTTDRKDP